jgi:hypothetical protein
VWILRDDKALLVDGWVARALVPEPLALHVRAPLAAAPRANELRSDDVRIAGRPRRARGALVDAELAHAIERAMAELQLVALGPQTGPAPESAAGADAQTVRVVGACGDHRLAVRSEVTGEGCVERAAWEAIAAAAAPLRGPPDAWIERRPLPSLPQQLVLADGGRLDLAKRPQLDGKDADPDRVAELAAALATRAEPAPLPAGKPTGSLTAGDVALDLYEHVLARRGEPIALRPTAEAWAAITRPSSSYRDPTRWLEEPTTISSITIDGVTYKRGAVLGEWPGAADPTLVEALATAIATVRAPAAAPAPYEHHIDFIVTPPAGAPVSHHLDVGRLTPQGCAGRADGQPVTLPLAICTAVGALRGR